MKAILPEGHIVRCKVSLLQQMIATYKHLLLNVCVLQLLCEKYIQILMVKNTKNDIMLAGEVGTGSIFCIR